MLVMELAPRGSLANICQNVNGGRLSEDQVRQIILNPLLDALSYLHAQGVCHRDIKVRSEVGVRWGPEPAGYMVRQGPGGRCSMTSCVGCHVWVC